ncbi:hypothetical protein LINGRAPRIM_LOCUS119 [Linum grandiflorum]
MAIWRKKTPLVCLMFMYIKLGTSITYASTTNKMCMLRSALPVILTSLSLQIPSTVVGGIQFSIRICRLM